MIPGIRFAGIASGIKNAALDLGLVFDEPSYVTAVYTKNKVKSAHILYNKKLRSNRGKGASCQQQLCQCMHGPGRG